MHALIGAAMLMAAPAARFLRAHMKAVLIRRLDGPLGREPMDQVTRIHVTRTR